MTISFLRPSQIVVLIGLICVLIGGSSGCSAKKPTSEPPATAETTSDSGDAVATSEGAPKAESAPKETCYGVVDCTLFGIGAVLATPFLVLGTLLGLVY
jgi:hypothetical protein